MLKFFGFLRPDLEYLLESLSSFSYFQKSSIIFVLLKDYIVNEFRFLYLFYLNFFVNFDSIVESKTEVFGLRVDKILFFLKAVRVALLKSGLKYMVLRNIAVLLGSSVERPDCKRADLVWQ